MAAGAKPRARDDDLTDSTQDIKSKQSLKIKIACIKPINHLI